MPDNESDRHSAVQDHHDDISRLGGGRIVVGIDGSPSSQQAAAWAVEEARLRGVDVEAIYAWYVPPLAGGYPEYASIAPDLTEAAGEAIILLVLGDCAARAGVTVVSTVVRGQPVAALRQAASREDVGLLVVGTYGHGGSATESLSGSVAHGLEYRSKKPIMFVPPRLPKPDMRVEPRIVVGVDGSTISVNALRWAAVEAKLRHAMLDVVITWSVSPLGYPPIIPLSKARLSALECSAGEALGRAVTEAELEVPVRQAVLRGSAASILVDRSASAELLVVGDRGLDAGTDSFLGSTSHACVCHATVPVVVVPGLATVAHRSPVPERSKERA